jgi:hypothetical protein
MPRYFFNIQDGKTILDDEGIELPDLDSARAQAVTSSGEMLRDGASSALWNGTAWKMWVTGEDKKTLFTLNFSATDA